MEARTPGRQTDSQLIKNKLEDAGFLVFDEVLDFLSQFEGLKFTFLNRKNDKIDDFNFVLDRVLEIEVPEKLTEDYISRVGQKLSVIGTCFREHFVLLLSEKGEMYGAFDDYMVLMGKSVPIALNGIVYDYEFIEVP